MKEKIQNNKFGMVLRRETQILENAFIYFSFYSQKESRNAVEFELHKTYNEQIHFAFLYNYES